MMDKNRCTHIGLKPHADTQNVLKHVTTHHDPNTFDPIQLDNNTKTKNMPNNMMSVQPLEHMGLKPHADTQNVLKHVTTHHDTNKFDPIRLDNNTKTKNMPNNMMSTQSSLLQQASLIRRRIHSVAAATVVPAVRLILIAIITLILTTNSTSTTLYSQASTASNDADITQAMRATVRIRGCNAGGCNQGLGSGVIIHPHGIILTANHVTVVDKDNPLSAVRDDFVIEMSENSRIAPIARYRARRIAAKPGADLAILQIYAEETTGEPVVLGELDLPHLPLANDYIMQTLDIKDEIEILGYPLSGGQFINYTASNVGGFLDEVTIKVQESLGEGNSGGPAIVASDNGDYVVAGIVIARQGRLGEVGLIRSIKTFHDFLWLNEVPLVWANNVDITAFNEHNANYLNVSLELHAIDYTDNQGHLLLYAFDAQTRQPLLHNVGAGGDTNLANTDGGQLIVPIEFTIEDSFTHTQLLEVIVSIEGLDTDLTDVMFRAMLWDRLSARHLWHSTDWLPIQQSAHPTKTAQAPTRTLVPVLPTATFTPISPSTSKENSFPDTRIVDIQKLTGSSDDLKQVFYADLDGNGIEEIVVTSFNQVETYAFINDTWLRIFIDTETWPCSPTADKLNLKQNAQRQLVVYCINGSGAFVYLEIFEYNGYSFLEELFELPMELRIGGAKVNIHNEQMFVSGRNLLYEFVWDGSKVITQILPLSDKQPANSHRIFFWRNGEDMFVSQDSIEIKVGQTIEFQLDTTKDEGGYCASEIAGMDGEILQFTEKSLVTRANKQGEANVSVFCRLGPATLVDVQIIP
ncbi:MAG: serine protease [Chloroflexota bacterium]